MKIIFGIFLLLASTALAAPCMTEPEARADALIGFFTTQAVAAALCEEKLNVLGMVALRKQVRKKFTPQIDAAANVREGYYQRQYGVKWREKILLINKKFVAQLLMGITVNIGLCMGLQSDLHRQLSEGWAYAASKVEEGFQAGLKDFGARLCREM